MPKGAVLIESKVYSKFQGPGLGRWKVYPEARAQLEKKAQQVGPPTILISKMGMAAETLSLFKVDCNLMIKFKPKRGDYIVFTSAVDPGQISEGGKVESVNSSAKCLPESDHRATDFRAN